MWVCTVNILILWTIKMADLRLFFTIYSSSYYNMKVELQNYQFSILTELEKQLPFYLIGAGAHYEQEPIDRPFGYPYFQWIQFLEGNGIVTIAGTRHEVEPGQAILLWPNVEHTYHAKEGKWIVSWFTFGGSHIERMLHTIGLTESGFFTVSDSTILENMIEKALFILQSDQPMKGLEASSIVYTFLLRLYRYVHITQDGSYDTQHHRLKEVFDYINSNYSNPITIDDLALVMNVSPQHFCMLFKRAVKCRPFEYINSFRINKSKSLLCEHPEMRIGEVAKLVGYESESYFCSMFKKIEGATPKQFRVQETGVLRYS